jgi:Zn-finger nucleic acid-binding protein
MKKFPYLYQYYLNRDSQKSSKKIHCPVCKIPMKSALYESVPIKTCLQCKGEWLGESALKNIVKIREARFSPEMQKAVLQSASIQGVRLTSVTRKLTCPDLQCQQTPLLPINYGGDSGVVVDRCEYCKGFWLDDQELEKIQILAESWQDGLSEDLAQYAPHLKKITSTRSDPTAFKHSSFGFINALLNGVLDDKV